MSTKLALVITLIVIFSDLVLTQKLTPFRIDKNTPRIYNGASFVQITYNVNEPFFVAIDKINGLSSEGISPFTRIFVECSGVKKFVKDFKMAGQYIIIPPSSCGQDYTGTNFELGVSPVPSDDQNVTGFWGTSPF